MRVIPESYSISTEQFVLSRALNDEHNVACTVTVDCSTFCPTEPTLIIAVPQGCQTTTEGAQVLENEINVMLHTRSNMTDATHAWVTSAASGHHFLLISGRCSTEPQCINVSYTAPGVMQVPLGQPHPEVPSSTTLTFLGRHGPLVGNGTTFVEEDAPSIQFRRATRPQHNLYESSNSFPLPRRSLCQLQ